VICTEDADESVADPANADTLLGNSLVEFLQAQCESGLAARARRLS
jgi:hypothetical protein